VKGTAVRLCTSWVLSSTNSSTKVHARRIPVRIEYLHDRITGRGFRYTIRYPNANRPNSCLMHGWSALCLNYQIRADVLELKTQSPDSSYIEIPTQGNNREMTYQRSGIINAITAANDQDMVLSNITYTTRELLAKSVRRFCVTSRQTEPSKELSARHTLFSAQSHV
jgi:hypothetical protein